MNRDITAANRAGWNLIAAKRHGRDLDHFRSGGTTLEDFGDYFGRQRPNTAQHPSKRPSGATTELFQPYVWPVSDVVMAFVRAGFRLDAFFEAPEPALYTGLGTGASALPAYYVIKATSARAGR